MANRKKKVALSKLDLIGHLHAQLKRVRNLCEQYDAGDIQTAPDLATKVRVILHETTVSKSLLYQLKLEHIKFLDTANEFVMNNIMPFNGLTLMDTIFDAHNKAVSVHAPKLDYAVNRNLIDFQNWWNTQVVIADGMRPMKNAPPRIIFTRSQLVRCLGNMDGGAHVDPNIDDDYHQLRNENLMGWIRHDGTALPNAVPSTMRQISYELLGTFDRIDITAESMLP